MNFQQKITNIPGEQTINGNMRFGTGFYGIDEDNPNRLISN